jgi:hypothetical protein
VEERKSVLGEERIAENKVVILLEVPDGGNKKKKIIKEE